MVKANKLAEIDDEELETSGRRSEAVDRRDVLKKSALLATGATTLGTGSAGTVAAAGEECTDWEDLDEKDNYVWDDDDSTQADSYDCDHLPNYYKVEHTSSLLYLGSCEQNNRWIHDFIATGHAEHFTREYCGDSWDRSYGIQQHRGSFDGNYSWLNFDARDDEWVKAHPDTDGTGDEPSAWMDWAYTGMAIAVGIKSWPAGAAMSLAAVYVDHVGGTPSTDYDLTYEWDIGGTYGSPCGSHFIWQDVQSDYGSSDAVSFDYIDEAWGRYPNYTRIEYDVQFWDSDPPEDGCGSSSTASTCSDNADGTPDPAPEVGEHITNSNGEAVEIVGTEQTVTETSGTDLTTADPEALSPNLREKVDLDEPVRYREFPMTITKTTIRGEILDESGKDST